MYPNPHKPSVSFIVLALNEEKEIKNTVKAIMRGKSRQFASPFYNSVGKCEKLLNFYQSIDCEGVELILVDDGSSDSTGEIMEKISAVNQKIKTIRNKKNLGLGGAWKRGVDFAQCDYVMMVAGDNIMPAIDIATIISRVGDADIVLPYLKNKKLRSLGRRFGSWGFKTLINILFGLRIKYYQGVLPRRNLLSKIKVETDSYAFPAEVTIKLIRLGCTFVEVGINHTPSHEKTSVALQPRRLVSVFLAVIQLVREIAKSRHKKDATI